MSGIETLYGVLLILALLLNGVAIAGRTTLGSLIAPAREGGLIVRIVALDLVLVPLVVVAAATLLGVDPVTRAGLVIVSAASCGPIAIALTRIAHGDVPLSVTLVVGLGALNLMTVPIVTGLLLPAGITIPLGTLVTTLLGLAVAPLVIGRLISVAATRLRIADVTYARGLGVAQRVGDVALAGAVTTALLLDTRAVIEVLAGPVLIVTAVSLAVITLAARAITPDPERRRTVAIAINARAVGLALTLATLHLGAVPGLRATILAYGGLTQLIPVLVVLVGRRVRGGGVSAPTG